MKGLLAVGAVTLGLIAIGKAYDYKQPVAHKPVQVHSVQEQPVEIQTVTTMPDLVGSTWNKAWHEYLWVFNLRIANEPQGCLWRDANNKLSFAIDWPISSQSIKPGTVLQKSPRPDVEVTVVKPQGLTCDPLNSGGGSSDYSGGGVPNVNWPGHIGTKECIGGRWLHVCA